MERNIASPKKHKAATASHLLKNLNTKDESQRAFFPANSKKTECHDLLLKHPFFWDDQKATNFLVSLGNIKDLPSVDRIEEKIERAMAVTGNHINKIIY